MTLYRLMKAWERFGREVRSYAVVVQILWHEAHRLVFCSWWGHSWNKVELGRHGYALSCRVCKDFRVPSRAEPR